MRNASPYPHPDARYCILMCPCAAIGPNDYRLSREAIMNKNLLVSILLALTVTAAAAQTPTKDALIARAKSFELDTSYVPPPGDPLTHHAAGFATVMCSAVFMTGLAPDFAAENVGFFTAPYGERAKLGKPVIDRANKAVHVRLPNGVTHTATYLGSQGCVTLPFLGHGVLGSRLKECTALVNAVEGRTILEILGSPDDLKFHSSMTLFDAVSSVPEFVEAISRFYGGKRDQRTLDLLEAIRSERSPAKYGPQ